LLINDRKILLGDSEALYTGLLDQHAHNTVLVNCESQIERLSNSAVCLGGEVELGVDNTGFFLYIQGSLVYSVVYVRLCPEIRVVQKLPEPVAERLLLTGRSRTIATILKISEHLLSLANRSSRECPKNEFI
jgi:hypothetical protein